MRIIIIVRVRPEDETRTAPIPISAECYLGYMLIWTAAHVSSATLHYSCEDVQVLRPNERYAGSGARFTMGEIKDEGGNCSIGRFGESQQFGRRHSPLSYDKPPNS